MKEGINHPQRREREILLYGALLSSLFLKFLFFKGPPRYYCTVPIRQLPRFLILVRLTPRTQADVPTALRVTRPATVACKTEAQSEHVHIAYYAFSHAWHRFAVLGRRSSTKISASELRRKSVKSALLVGLGTAHSRVQVVVYIPTCSIWEFVMAFMCEFLITFPAH